ncbi:MAG TPA: hypothetical protein VK668_07430 [Mucilaginibacter sp.]|nr:hypothetical protein [Mucilaginibacter sp.]
MKLLTFLLLSTCLSFTSFKPNNEINLYNSSGNAGAFIDDYLSDQVIYLWDGKPVAYLHQNFTSTDIYGFNGKHLGWFEKGVLRDNSGHTVGVTKEASDKITAGESLKGIKGSIPDKKYRELEPPKPYFSTIWASTDLKEFLMSGVDN